MLENIFLFNFSLENKSFEEINNFLLEIKEYLLTTEITNIEDNFYFLTESLFNNICNRFLKLKVSNDIWNFFVDNVYNSTSVTAILIKEQNKQVELIDYWKNNVKVGLIEYEIFVKQYTDNDVVI